MKNFIRILLAGVIFAAAQGSLHADAGYSFSFTVKQTKGGGTKKEYDYETVKNQKFSYEVTMANKSFKDVSDIEVKYVVFTQQNGSFEVRTIGGHQDLQRHEGSTSIKLLKNNDSVVFSTTGIMLTNVRLSDDYWDGEEGAKGALKGLWLRIYVGGQMVAEFTDPTNLGQKQTFDPPPKDN